MVGIGFVAGKPATEARKSVEIGVVRIFPMPSSTDWITGSLVLLLVALRRRRKLMVTKVVVRLVRFGVIQVT